MVFEKPAILGGDEGLDEMQGDLGVGDDDPVLRGEAAQFHSAPVINDAAFLQLVDLGQIESGHFLAVRFEIELNANVGGQGEDD